MQKNYAKNNRTIFFKAKMNILHCITDLQTGGAETALTRLIQYDRSGHQHFVLNLQKGGSRAAVIRSLGVLIIEFNSVSSIVGLLKFLFLLSFIKIPARPTVIVGWLPHGMLASYLLKVFRYPHIPLIWAVRSDVKDKYSLTFPNRLIARLCNRLSKTPSRITYNSETSKSNHINKSGFPKIGALVIPNGFDHDYFCISTEMRVASRLKWSIPADSLVIVFVSRLHPDKDIPTFVEALHRCIQNVPNVIALIAGNKLTINEPTVAALFSVISPKYFRLLGEVEDISTVFAAGDIGTLTSRSEAFPNAIGEAMASGLPCVATNSGDCNSIIGETGMIVPIGDVDGLARAWVSLLHDQALRKNLGLAARQRIIEHFSMNFFSKSYADLFDSII